MRIIWIHLANHKVRYQGYFLIFIVHERYEVST